jgi:small-conductance mechanosensitive channel
MIRSLGGDLSIVPNGQVGTIINYSTRKSNLLIDFPIKADQNIDQVLRCMHTALTLLQKDERFDGKILPKSTINGIEDFKPVGPMIVRATIVTSPTLRFDVGRAYRYLVKREFEKNKVVLG